jgi:DNA-binding LytR/AlgR family response regulator
LTLHFYSFSITEKTFNYLKEIINKYFLVEGFDFCFFEDNAFNFEQREDVFQILFVNASEAHKINKDILASKELYFIFLLDENKINSENFKKAYFLEKVNKGEVFKLLVNLMNFIRVYQVEQNNSKTFKQNKSHFAYKTMESIEFIEIDQIVYCEAHAVKTKIHLADNTNIVLLKNIGKYEELLAPNLFYRIHSKYLINLKHLMLVHRNNVFFCLMNNGTRLPVSKRKQKKFLEFTQLSFCL